MLDSKYIRQNLAAAAEKLASRGFELNVAVIESLESQRKALQIETQNLQNERNTRSKSIGQAKAKGEDIRDLLANVNSLGEQLKQKEEA